MERIVVFSQDCWWSASCRLEMKELNGGPLFVVQKIRCWFENLKFWDTILGIEVPILSLCLILFGTTNSCLLCNTQKTLKPTLLLLSLPCRPPFFLLYALIKEQRDFWLSRMNFVTQLEDYLRDLGAEARKKHPGTILPIVMCS